MKKNMKKVIALLCTFAIALTTFPAVAKAETPVTDFKYKAVDGQTIEITEYLGNDSQVDIPEKIEGKKVTHIGAAAFRGKTTLTQVHAPNVTTIKDSAFSGCSNLTRFWSFKTSSIGDSAFENCTSLNHAPSLLDCTQIGTDAFLNCTSLTTVELPASVTTLGNHCFGYFSTGTTYTLNPAFSISCTAGSAALKYAQANKIKYTITACDHIGMITIPAKKPTDTADGNNEYYYCPKCLKYFKDAAGTKETTPQAETLPRTGVRDIKNATITAIAEQYYTGKDLTPAVTVRYGNILLVLNTDYTVTYQNNKNIGTATITITGKGNYTGSQITTFRIVGKNIANAALSAISDQTYTGSAITPALTLKDGLLTLKNGTDYKVTYTDNVNVGTATVTITGLGSYGGTKVATFKIVSNTITITAKDHYFSYSEKERKFTIKATSTPAAELKYTSDSDGISITTKKKSTGNVAELTMDSGFSGVAVITITATKAGFQTATKQFSIYVPKAVKITEATRTGTNSATVLWSTNSSIHGYTLQYSKSEKFSVDRKELSVTGDNYRVKGLEKNQVYYIRIRTYYEVNGVEYYSKWSSAKRIEGSVAPSLLYERYLNKQAEKVQKILSYTLLDLNDDGVEELLYKYYNGGNRNCGKICTIVDGKVKMLKNQKDGSPNFYQNSKKEIMMDSSTSSKEKVYRVYSMKNGKLTLIRTYRSNTKEDGKYEYTLDGKKIKKSEFKKMKKEFKKLETTSYETK
jgi:hypothetical protein